MIIVMFRFWIIFCFTMCCFPLFSKENNLATEYSGIHDSRTIGPCDTPRQALTTWLIAIYQEPLDIKSAQQCMILPKNMSKEKITISLQYLKRTIQAQGIRINLEQVPDDENYINISTMQSSYNITRSIPELILEKEEQEWKFPLSVFLEAQRIHEQAVAVDLWSIVAQWSPWWHQTYFNMPLWQPLLFALWLIICFMLRWILEKMFYALFIFWSKQYRSIQTTILHRSLHALSWPFVNCAVLLLLWWTIPFFQFSVTLSRGILTFVLLLCSLFGSIVIYRALDFLLPEEPLPWSIIPSTTENTESRSNNSFSLDRQWVPLVRRIAKIFLIIFTTIWFLWVLHVDVGSLLAGLGIGGLAIALAAKDTLGNFFGSLMIVIDKPFRIGDIIKVFDIEGTVEHVGFRSTRIRTYEDSLLTIPNAKLADHNIENFGARRKRKVKWEWVFVPTTQKEKLHFFESTSMEFLKKHSLIHQDDIHVSIRQWNAQGVFVVLHFFLNVSSWQQEQQIKESILLALHDLMKEFQLEQSLFMNPITMEGLISTTLDNALDEKTMQQRAKHWLVQQQHFYSHYS